MWLSVYALYISSTRKTRRVLEKSPLCSYNGNLLSSTQSAQVHYTTTVMSWEIYISDTITSTQSVYVIYSTTVMSCERYTSVTISMVYTMHAVHYHVLLCLGKDILSDNKVRHESIMSREILIKAATCVLESQVCLGKDIRYSLQVR